MPQSIQIDKPYANFYFLPKKEGNSLTINASYLAKTGTFPATLYDDYIDFRQTVNRLNRSLDLSFIKK